MRLTNRLLAKLRYAMIICCTLEFMVITCNSQTQIPSNFFGLNGWMPAQIGTSVSIGNTVTAGCCPSYSYNYNPGGMLNTYSLCMSQSSLGIKMLRYGGILHDIDININDATCQQQYVDFVNMCNSLSINPILQIPFISQVWSYPQGSISAASSAGTFTSGLLSFIQNSLNPLGVKYYSIANESDRYSVTGFSVAPSLSTALTATDIGTYFRNISKVIKTANPSAIVVGPDLSYAHVTGGPTDLSYGLLSGSITAGDITSTYTNNLHYCDIYAVHGYGFVGPPPTRTAVIAHPSTTFSSYLNSLRSIITNSASNPNLKIAITELQIATANPTPAASNSYSNLGANGFLAGQWLAEMYAVGLTYTTGAQVAFMCPWALHESSGDRTVNDLGIIDGSVTPTPSFRSTYYHTKMMAEGFSGGLFYMGVTTNTNVKAFSSKDCSHITNFFMNQDDVNSHTLIVSQTSVTPIGAGDVSVTLNMQSSWSNKTIVLGPSETQMFIYDACGTTKKHYTYSQSTYSTYPAPTLVTSNASLFCSCSKRASSNYPNYNLRCASVTGTQAIHYSSVTLSSSLTLNDSAYISGNLTVPRGLKLTINNAEIVMDDNAKIVVQTGGQLVISGSNLHACSGSSTGWNGIEITGDNTDASQVSITNSSITDALVAIKAIQVQSITVTGNYFNNGAQAIRLSGCKGFDIEDNDFVSYTSAINTNTCLSATSSIKNNMFFEQDTAIYFDSDAHTTLDIACNGLIDYTSYGIYSHNATLKSQGSATSGAGNEFLSNSAYTNHQINHSANAISYYTDPSFSFTLAGSSAGYSVTTFTASADAACYSVSPRMAHFQTIAKSYTGESKLFNCYPNPANNTVTFSYLLENKVRNASIIISDLFGRRVKEIILQSETETTNENLTDLSSGIYFYTLLTDGRAISSRKIIISK